MARVPELTRFAKRHKLLMITIADLIQYRVRTEGLWIKCQDCGQIIWKAELDSNLQVCPKCGHHFKLGALARIDALLEPGYELVDGNLASTDPLKFEDLKPYSKRLKKAQETTVLKDAVASATGVLGRLVQPLLQWSWLTFLPLRLAEASPRPSLTAANGQVLACNAATYRQAGGHAAFPGPCPDRRHRRGIGGPGAVACRAAGHVAPRTPAGRRAPPPPPRGWRPPPSPTVVKKTAAAPPALAPAPPGGPGAGA